MRADLADDLDGWLRAVSDRYEVERTLKRTPTETTEIVWRRAQVNICPIGPFVRKTFTNTDGRGSAYTDIWRAQVSGTHLKNLPIIYECEDTEDGLQVVMEYVNGENLQQLVEHEAPGIALAAIVMPGLCDAASELHESLEYPVIHRDIKPSNVIVSGNQVTLIDLGIARQWHEGAERDTERLGTPGYAPPEQYGFGQTDVRSDVFALGMTCVFCLTGEMCSRELQDRGFKDRRIPKEVARVLKRACSFDPAARHASARELKDALCQALPVSDLARPKVIDPYVSVGIAWNVLLILAWVFIFSAVMYASFASNGPFTDMPRSAVILIYVLFAQIPMTCLVFLIADKRRLRRRITQLSTISRRQEVIGCLAASAISIVLSFVVVYLFRR